MEYDRAVPVSGVVHVHNQGLALLSLCSRRRSGGGLYRATIRSIGRHLIHACTRADRDICPFLILLAAAQPIRTAL